MRWIGGLNDHFYASPSIVGNRVYNIGSSEDRGRIFCWARDTGDLQWVVEPEEMRATFSSPVIVGQRMLCGEGTHRSEQSRIFCFDISQPDQAELIWSHTTSSHVECTPAVVGNRVYVGAGDDGVYALSLAGGARGQPVVHWHVSGDQIPDVETALVADENRVIVGSGSKHPAVVCLDSQTGHVLASWSFDLPIHAPPGFAGDYVYVGMGRGNYIETPMHDRGAVAAIDLSSGQVMWSLSLPATILGAVVVDEGELFCGGADGLLRVISSDGKLLRTWDAESAVHASLAVTPTRIVGVTIRGRLFCLDRTTLTLVDERQLGMDGVHISSPVIVEDKVFIGTERSGMQCLGPLP